MDRFSEFPSNSLGVVGGKEIKSILNIGGHLFSFGSSFTCPKLGMVLAKMDKCVGALLRRGSLDSLISLHAGTIYKKYFALVN